MGINSKKKRRLFLSSATIDDLVAIIEGRYSHIRVNELISDPLFDWVCDHLNELCEMGVKYLAPLLLRAAERFDMRFIFDKLFRYFMRLVEKATLETSSLETSSPDFLAVFEACIVPDSSVLRLVLQHIDANGYYNDRFYGYVMYVCRIVCSCGNIEAKKKALKTFVDFGLDLNAPFLIERRFMPIILAMIPLPPTQKSIKEYISAFNELQNSATFNIGAYAAQRKDVVIRALGAVLIADLAKFVAWF